jgi:hypothetical protein
VADGLQECEITPRATTTGDAGILKTFAASENQEFSASARARITGVSGEFKARLTIAAKRADGSQLKEWNDRITDASQDFAEMKIDSAAMPQGTELVSVKFRAHSSQAGSSGIAQVAELHFERLR